MLADSSVRISCNGSMIEAIRAIPDSYKINEETKMAKKSAKASAEAVYKIVEVIGSSTKSWEDAARSAVEAAAKTLRDLRIAEITKLDMKIDDGKVVAYRARVSLSFKYQG